MQDSCALLKEDCHLFSTRRISQDSNVYIQGRECNQWFRYTVFWNERSKKIFKKSTFRRLLARIWEWVFFPISNFCL